MVKSNNVTLKIFVNKRERVKKRYTRAFIRGGRLFEVGAYSTSMAVFDEYATNIMKNSTLLSTAFAMITFVKTE